MELAKYQLLYSNTTHREPAVLVVDVRWADTGTVEIEVASEVAGEGLRARPVAAATTLIVETIVPVAATLK